MFSEIVSLECQRGHGDCIIISEGHNGEASSGHLVLVGSNSIFI